MSLKENDVWAEAAIENLEEALDAGNWEHASAIMADTRDRGMEEVWKVMLNMFNHYKYEDR